VKAEKGLTIKVSLLVLGGKTFLENTSDKKNSGPQELIKKHVLVSLSNCQPPPLTLTESCTPVPAGT